MKDLEADQAVNMLDAKPESTPIAAHFQLSVEQSPETEDELVYMDKVPYASVVGSLMYAMVCTRPDIAHAVGVVSRYMSNPDADNGGDVDSRKSTSGYVFTFGGTAISWRSKLQPVVALSSCEVEYVAMTEAVKEMIWLQTFLKELNLEYGSNTLYCDSQSAIYLAKNPIFHARTKHIGLRYHFILSVLENVVLKLEKILGDQNPADMFTKVVNKEKLKLCSTSVNL
ncbi:hypothetical protein LIER_41501 [Lithospermum erythrorhizon]|uniref:Retrovirus-related Pol polyprotein from transposon TNT 1-94 n=1 Tax=Lithospermum erythrorhizon TaxID=34254 RepID=A0AAV3RAI7_LITER